MSIRQSTSTFTLSLALLAAGLLSSAAVQSPASDDGDWVLPRTPAGHPDLQGNWNNETVTPFQRQADHGPVFTAEEVATREGREADRIVAGAAPSDPNRPAPEAGARTVGTYNDFYWDRGNLVAIVNGEPRASLLTNPPDGRVPPMTPAGEERMAEYRAFRGQFGQYDNPENRPLAERCILSFGSSAGPPMIPNNAYNNNYTIVQNADFIMIMAEMVHDVRIIRLGEPRPLPAHVRPWMGDSWGRWEDDTLVVETTNIHPLQTFRSIPPSEHLKVTERFSRVDEETILYEFTYDDPTTYTKPWGGEIPYKSTDARVYEYSCHEGNYALSSVLSGARYQEREGGGN